MSEFGIESDSALWLTEGEDAGGRILFVSLSQNLFVLLTELAPVNQLGSHEQLQQFPKPKRNRTKLSRITEKTTMKVTFQGS